MELEEFRKLSREFLNHEIDDFPDDAFKDFQPEIDTLIELEGALEREKRFRKMLDETVDKAKQFDILQKAFSSLWNAINFGRFMNDKEE